jgi:multiple sugar transport system substrate-binding protein
MKKEFARGRVLITLVLAGLLLAGTILAACVPAAPPTAEPAAPTEAAPEPTKEAEAPAPEPSEEEVVLHIMDNWGADPTHSKYTPLHSAFDDFMALYPNIKIEEEVFEDHDIPTKVVTMYMAGDEPDLVLQNLHQAALDWLDDGVTIDVTDLAQEWGLYDTMKTSAVAEWTDSQGRLRAFPVEGYTWPVWYNMGILNEAGIEEVPKTTDELIAAANAVREAGYQPYATGGSEWTGQFDFFLTLTTYLTDEEIVELYSKGGWSDNPNAVKGVELFAELRDAGVFVDDAEGMTNAARNEMFYSEEAAMMHGGAWFYADAPDEIKDHIVLGGFPLPPGSSREKPPIYASFEGKGLWITRNGAEKMDAVEKFVKFFFQPEIMARFVEQAAMTSPLKETPVDESKLDPLFVQSVQFGDDVEVALIHKVYVPPEASDNLRRVANEAWVPGTSAETILEHLDEVYENLGIQ